MKAFRRKAADLENPSDPPQKKTTFLIPFPLPRVHLPKFTTSRALILFLILQFLCYQTHSLHCTMLCLHLAILFVIYFLFKNRSRLTLPCFFKKKRPTFFIGNEDMNTKQFRRLLSSPSVEYLFDGTVYAGEFYKGSSTGRGVMKIPGKSTYMGDWIDGAYDGYGVERLAGCGKYKGKFWKGMRHGFGSMRFYNRDQYSGEWRYGERDGMGEQTCAGGSSYVGEFRKGMKNGVGIYCFRNADMYLGEYFCDKLHGFGVYYFSNGDYYQGSWHDSHMAGYGVYTKRDGEMLSGMWVDGALVSRIPSAFRCIRMSVKAAKKAAQRSRDLRRVEYHVCQAVYAARNAAKVAQLVSIALFKGRELHRLDPRRLVLWMCHMFADRFQGESQVESAKKAIRELSYCLKSSTPSISTAFLTFWRLSGRCGLLLTEGEQVHEEYLVSQPDSRSTAETCFIISPKKRK
ncbi:hypothetical protein FCM35_KLT02778 [Carex littledalei]|uniref:Uncharacterized protein n=1 Tax=Carex littledalei TaxID=544730 RepID=A0A833R3D8_9POAL|nr:hypothetical protein FCM35_KLT02778 [Carex littledalei]